jgi:EmrB/QacA subfamily drug resistance transporter
MDRQETPKVIEVPLPTTAEMANRGIRRWFALPVILAGTFMTILDFFIVNVAIPSAQADLHADSSEVQLIVAGYGLAYAAGLITGGRLGDLYGRRRLFAIGLAAFTLFSVACGLAPNAVLLVLFRVLQGASASMLFPQVLSILNVAYSGQDRPKAFMSLGITIGLASVSGQIFGGLLIGANPWGLGWRACFLINLPIGLLALTLLGVVVRESRSDRASRLDIVGVGLIGTALLFLLYPLVVGREAGWPAWSWACMGAGVAGCGVFALHQIWLSRRGGTPLVPPILFRERAFVVGLLSVLSVYAGMASFFLVFALYLQKGLGISPLSSGLIFMPCGLGFFLISLCAPRLTQLLGRRVLTLGAVTLGMSETVLSIFSNAAGRHPSAVVLCLLMFAAGAGMGAMGSPLLSQVLAGIPASEAGAASGVLSTVQQLAGALGVALIGILFFGALGKGAGYSSAFSTSLLLTIALAGITALITAPSLWWDSPRGRR